MTSIVSITKDLSPDRPTRLKFCSWSGVKELLEDRQVEFRRRPVNEALLKCQYILQIKYRRDAGEMLTFKSTFEILPMGLISADEQSLTWRHN